MKQSHRGRVETLGILGVGKSTFLKSCQPLLDSDQLVARFEELDSIREEIEYWLERQETRSHFIQTVFYTHAAKLLSFDSEQTLILADFSLTGHHFIYSRTLLRLGLLTELEFAALEELHSILDSLLPPLQGFILCEAPLTLVIERTLQRNRSTETSVDQSYLRLLETSLAELASQTALPVYRIDTSEFNPTHPALPEGFNSFISNCTAKL